MKKECIIVNKSTSKSLIPTFKFGEKVLVSNNKEDWDEALFVCKNTNLECPFIVNKYNVDDIQELKEQDDFISYKYCVKPVELTKEQIAEKFGIEPYQIIINN